MHGHPRSTWTSGPVARAPMTVIDRRGCGCVGQCVVGCCCCFFAIPQRPRATTAGRLMLGLSCDSPPIVRGNKSQMRAIRIALLEMRQDAKIHMHGDLEGFRSSWSVSSCMYLSSQVTEKQLIVPIYLHTYLPTYLGKYLPEYLVGG